MNQFWGFFHVQQHDDQGKEHHHEGANLDQLCRQRDCVQPSHSDTDTLSYTRSVSLQIEGNPIHTSCSSREMSRMKCGHPGNFLNVSYKEKVNEFTDFDSQ